MQARFWWVSTLGANSSSVGCTQIALYPALCLFQGLSLLRKKKSACCHVGPTHVFWCFLWELAESAFSILQLWSTVDVLQISSCQEPQAPVTSNETKKNTARCGCSFFDQSCCKKWKKGSFLCVDVKQVFFLLAQIGTGRFWSRFTVASFWCFGARTWPHLANHLPWEAGHPRRSWRTRLAGFCCMLWYCTAFLTLSLSHIKPIFRTQFGCPFFCLVFCFLVVFILHSRHVRQSDRKCTTYLASRSLASQRAATCTWAKRLYHTRPTTPREKQQQQNLVQWWCQMTKQRIYVILSYLCHQL